MLYAQMFFWIGSFSIVKSRRIEAGSFEGITANFMMPLQPLRFPSRIASAWRRGICDLYFDPTFMILPWLTLSIENL
jgi:hypothetical protein